MHLEETHAKKISLPDRLCLSPRLRDFRWCWKRDRGALQRAIFFSGRLDDSPDARETILSRWTFFYRHRLPHGEANQIHALLTGPSVREYLPDCRIRKSRRAPYSEVEIFAGPHRTAEAGVVRRLLRGRPRPSVPQGSFPAARTAGPERWDFGPVTLYVGSGLSYEAGLPTLSAVHEDFGVDSAADDSFTFGVNDPIPALLDRSVRNTFARFLGFHRKAAAAKPSPTHGAICELHRRGQISRVLSENVDDLLEQSGIPTIRVRTTFPVRRPVSFDQDETLIVVGVAADRRQIIQQARTARCRIIVVNPMTQVSPRAQNLSYMRASDSWYKIPAREFFACERPAGG